MPNIKSAKKRVEVIAKKTLENKMINSRLKTTLKKYNVALVERDFKKAEELLPATISEIDSACTKGVLHKNCASRKKAQVYGNLTKAKIAAKNEEALKAAQKPVEEKAPEAAPVVEATKAPAKKAAKKAEEPKAEKKAAAPKAAKPAAEKAEKPAAKKTTKKAE